MKKLIVLFAAMMLGAGLYMVGCDDDDDSAPPANDVDSDSDSDTGGDTDTDTDTGTDGDTDTDTDTGTDADTDTDTDTGSTGSCTNNDADYPGEFHCNYKTAFVQKNCYEYAKGVSRADAEADCKKHLQGGPGGLATNTRVFGDGPCALTTTGYCFTAKQTPCGREFTISTYKGDADCKPATTTSAAWGCETMGNGEYTCTL